MLSKEIKDMIFRDMPDKVTVQGHTMNVYKRYANQYTYEKFPAITLEYGKSMTMAAPSLDDFTRKTERTEQIITYVTGTTTYVLDKTYVMEIEEVVGVVGGIDYTFLPEEYEMSGGTPPWYTSIHFLGPTLPDNGTDVYVTYRHAWIRVYVGGLFVEGLTINIWAKDMEVQKPGGKENLNGIFIADQLAEDIWKWLKYDVEEVEDQHIFSVRNVSEIMVLDSQVVGEEIRRRQIELEVLYVQEWERTSQETIESTNEDVIIG